MKTEKIRRLPWLFAAVFVCLTAGCGSSVSIFPGTEEDAGTVDAVPGDGSENGEAPQEDRETEDGETPGCGDSDLPEQISQEDAGEAGSQEKKEIYVDVAGAVCAPGVYTLPEGSRVFQAIEMAGGFAENAHRESMNQAGLLEDGQQIRVYTKEEAELLEARGQMTAGEQSSPAGTGNDTGGKVNLNTAGKEELMTLTGIGETRAEAILAYREESGGFRTTRDLMQVEGIKEKTYEKIKDQITVD